MRRRLMVAAGKRSLYIYTGVDTAMQLRLEGATLVCEATGGAGTHDGLYGWTEPPLYFGSAACYCRFGDIGLDDDAVIAAAADLFHDIWQLDFPLPLGFKPAKIDRVELIGSGREDVSCGRDASGYCYVRYDDDTITINDSESSSSMYCIKISFK